MVTGPMGPFIHFGQRNRNVSNLRPFRTGSDYAVWWIGSGRATLTIDQERQVLCPPAAVLQQPDGRTSLELAPGTPWCRFLFDAVHQPLERGSGGGGITRVHRDQSRQPVPEAIWGCPLPYLVPEPLVGPCRRMFDDCLAWWWRSDLDLYRANLRLGAWLTALVAAAMPQPKVPRIDWFLACCDLIEERLELGLTIAGLAEHAGLSPATFRRHFQARAGVSPRSYLAEARLRRACHLMETDGSDLRDVAARSGFASRSTFALRFRAWTGCSPGVWRRQHRP